MSAAKKKPPVRSTTAVLADDEDTQSVRVSKRLVQRAGIAAKLSGTSSRDLMDQWISEGLTAFEKSSGIKLPVPKG